MLKYTATILALAWRCAGAAARRPVEVGRHQCRTLRALNWPLDESERCGTAEVKTRLAEALDKMNATDREVLALRHFEQLIAAEARRSWEYKNRLLPSDICAH